MKIERPKSKQPIPENATDALTQEHQEDLLRVEIDPGVTLKSFLSFIKERRTARFIITEDLAIILSFRIHNDIEKAQGFQDCLIWNGYFQLDANRADGISFLNSFSGIPQEAKKLESNIKDKIKSFLKSQGITEIK